MIGQACLGHDPEAWFPVASEGGRANAERAIAVCRTCPVVKECAKLALDTLVDHGVWGGLWLEDPTVSTSQRRRHLAIVAEMEIPSSGPARATGGHLPKGVRTYLELRSDGVSNLAIADRLGIKVNSLNKLLGRHGVAWIADEVEQRFADEFDEIVRAGVEFSANDLPFSPALTGAFSQAVRSGRIVRTGNTRSARHGGRIGVYRSTAVAQMVGV